MLVNRELHSPDPDEQAGGGAAADKGDEATKIAEAEQALAEARGIEPEQEVVQGKDGKKRVRVPLERHKAILEAERKKAEEIQQKLEQTQAELDALAAAQAEQEAAARPQVDPAQEIANYQAQIDSLEDKYEDLMAEGKKLEARQVRVQVRYMQNQLVDYKTALQAERARVQASDSVMYQQTLQVIEDQFPELNPDSEEFNPDADAEVSEVMGGLVAQGYSKADALQRAINYVFRPAPAQDPRLSEREVAQRQRNAEAMTRQPASLRDAGMDHDRAGARDGAVDVMRLSMNQFDKLGEETKARLRGDEV